jgi:hypothetical protein
MVMAFAPHVIREGARSAVAARGRREEPRGTRGHFVRRQALGSVAIYEIVDEGSELVTAEVVAAPGLEPGTRVRMLASAVRAMDEVEPGRLVRLPRALRRAAGIPPRAA